MKPTLIYSIPFRITRGVPEFLVLKRAPDKFVPPDFWQMVSGTIEPGEWSPETAIREVEEETGLKVRKLLVVDYLHEFWLAHWDEIVSIPVFACEMGRGSVTLSEEHVDYRWLSYGAAINRLPRRSQRQALRVFLEDIIRDKRDEEFLLWTTKRGWKYYTPEEQKLRGK